jgi:lipopolysaccharide transport system permease protein
MIRNLRELYQYRALLWALTVRELRARYRASVLGFLWTFLNPTLSMAVYVLVFSVLMVSDTPRYPYYIFSGLLPWIYFSSAIAAGTSAVSERRDLLTKVRFPAQVLPATVVLTNAINFLLSIPLLVILGVFYAQYPTWHFILIVPLLLVQTLFTLAITYVLSALNVAFRDLQHIIGNILQLAFFVTPIVWRLEQVQSVERQHWVLYLNPIAALVEAWHDVFFRQRMPETMPLVVVTALSLVMMWLASNVFEQRREEFAELI